MLVQITLAVMEILFRFPFDSLIIWQTFPCFRKLRCDQKLSSWLQTKKRILKSIRVLRRGRGEKEDDGERKIMLKRQSITDVERSINIECTVITQSTVNGSNFLSSTYGSCVYLCLVAVELRCLNLERFLQKKKRKEAIWFPLPLSRRPTAIALFSVLRY